jgi:putative hydrolase of the HAD superfamily
VVEAVIVDIGGVIALPPRVEDFALLQSLCGFSGDGFVDAWFRDRAAYDRGELTAAEYWRLVGLAGDSRLEDVLAADVDAWSRCDAAVVEWLGALRRAGVRTAVLSNMPREQWDGLALHYRDWLPLCDHITLSFEVGTAKPDERIYRHCLDAVGVAAEEAVFVDDRTENVEAAARLGLHALLYTGVVDLRRQLAARFDGALPLPS